MSDSMTGQSTEGPIGQHLGDITIAIDELQKEVMLLQERIQPVLSPVSEKAKAEMQEPPLPPDLSHAEKRCIVIMGKIDKIRQFVRVVTDRVRV